MTDQPPKAPCDIGILFVHGIGHQQRGETLIQCGEGIYNWISAWFAGVTEQRIKQLSDEERQQWSSQIQTQWGKDVVQNRVGAVDVVSRQIDAAREFMLPAAPSSPSEQPNNWQPKDVFGLSAQLLDTRIDSSNDGNEAPAHAQLNLLRLNGDGTSNTSSWLLAESWWAESLYPPRFSDLAFWGGKVLPSAIGSHFGTRIRRAWGKFQASTGWRQRLPSLGQILADLIMLPISLSIGVVVIALLLLLLLVQLLPIPWLGTFTLTIAQRLGSWLGDSYVLVANPLQTASMVGQVSRDLAWLTRQCPTVILVAHSQGAAVAHLGLRQKIPDQLHLLFTYGSGLRKLEELFELMRPQQQKNALPRFVDPLTLGAISLLSSIILPLVWPSFLIPRVLLLGLGIVLIGWGGIRRAATTNDRLMIWAEHFQHSGLQWQDYYASNDPVPNGPLFDQGDFPATVEVHNARSFLRDHSSYWQNNEQFIGDVVRSAIATLKDPVTKQAFEDLLPSLTHTQFAKVCRQWRTQVLRLVRWAARLAGLILIYVHRAEWQSLGNWISATLSELWSGTLPFSSVLTKILGFAPLFLTFGALVLLSLAYLMIHAVWQTWGRGELTALFAQADFGKHNWLRILAFALAVGFLAPLTYTLATSPWVIWVDLGYLLKTVGAWSALSLIVWGLLLVFQPHE